MLTRLARKYLKSVGYSSFPADRVPNSLRQNFADIVARYGIDCVLDVGANVGQFGQAIRQWGYEGRIVSFEPVSHVYRKLEAVAVQDPLWQCRNLALGEWSEERTINVVPDLDVLSSFHKLNAFSHERWEASRHADTETVRVERLDAIMDDIRHSTGCARFYLKLDTQGFDLPAFRGARGVLGSIHAMQSELAFRKIYNEPSDVYETLSEYRDAGFHPCGIHPVSRNDSHALIEADGVFVRKTGT